MASASLPLPTGPQSIRAWGRRSSLTICISRSLASCCPITSLQVILYYSRFTISHTDSTAETV